MTEIDVELQRDASWRAAVGSVGRPKEGPITVVILDSEWRRAGMEGLEVPTDSPIARLAAHLAVNEPGGEAPWPSIKNDRGLEHYPVDSEYITKAAETLAASAD